MTDAIGLYFQAIDVILGKQPPAPAVHTIHILESTLSQPAKKGIPAYSDNAAGLNCPEVSFSA